MPRSPGGASQRHEPTLILSGEADTRTTPAASAHELSRYYRTVSRSMPPDRARMMPYEQPDAFTRTAASSTATEPSGQSVFFEKQSSLT